MHSVFRCRTLNRICGSTGQRGNAREHGSACGGGAGLQADLRVRLHAFGTGPFAGGASRIKNVYLVKGAP